MTRKITVFLVTSITSSIHILKLYVLTSNTLHNMHKLKEHYFYFIFSHIYLTLWTSNCFVSAEENNFLLFHNHKMIEDTYKMKTTTV